MRGHHEGLTVASGNRPNHKVWELSIVWRGGVAVIFTVWAGEKKNIKIHVDIASKL